MGLVHADIELANGEDLVLARRKLMEADKIRRMTVRANVDSGAYMLCVNERVRTQLGLPKVEDQIAILADGSQHTLDVIGPIEVRFQNRRCMVDAMVLPGDNEVLLGANPLEDMDLVVLPREQRLAVNPAHPILPAKPVK